MDIPTLPSGELVQKTVPGAFWHLEAHSRRRGSYVRTRCGRRLGQWHLAAQVTVARDDADADADAMCASCLRKVSEG